MQDTSPLTFLAIYPLISSLLINPCLLLPSFQTLDEESWGVQASDKVLHKWFSRGIRDGWSCWLLSVWLGCAWPNSLQLPDESSYIRDHLAIILRRDSAVIPSADVPACESHRTRVEESDLAQIRLWSVQGRLNRCHRSIQVQVRESSRGRNRWHQ